LSFEWLIFGYLLEKEIDEWAGVMCNRIKFGPGRLIPPRKVACRAAVTAQFVE
jgi:hypothetical protein